MENSRLLARNNHTYENGRRYHGFKGEFPFPDDKKGQAHHGLLDYLWRKILDWQLFTVPITPLKKNHKVLDFATRSGAWVTELRNLENFQSKITAMDPSFMQRHDARYFVHHDLEGEWPFSSKQAFHYIHAQSLGGLIADWEGFHRNAYKHLVPGGWLEVKENDIRLYSEKDTTLDNRAPNVKQWEELMEQAAERFGKKINVAGMQRELMEGAGFVEVKEQVFKVRFFFSPSFPSILPLSGFNDNIIIGTSWLVERGSEVEEHRERLPAHLA